MLNFASTSFTYCVSLSGIERPGMIIGNSNDIISGDDDCNNIFPKRFSETSDKNRQHIRTLSRAASTGKITKKKNTTQRYQCPAKAVKVTCQSHQHKHRTVQKSNAIQTKRENDDDNGDSWVDDNIHDDREIKDTEKMHCKMRIRPCSKGN